MFLPGSGGRVTDRRIYKRVENKHWSWEQVLAVNYLSPQTIYNKSDKFSYPAIFFLAQII